MNDLEFILNFEENKTKGIWLSGIEGEGEFLRYHENGQLWRHEFFKNGERHGESKWYHENGQLWMHELWENEKLKKKEQQMIKLKLDEKWEKKDFLNNKNVIEQIDRLTRLKIELSIERNSKKLKGNTEISISNNNWTIRYKPQESTNLYLFSKELIIGKDGKSFFKEDLKDNWELEDIKNGLISAINLFNKVIGE